ncbi:MAG: M20 family metallopeptidase [Bacillota bacterium]|nr:M20 family metallopeptidase [Bacillota bacterium]
MNNLKKAAIESVDSMAQLYEKIADEIWENPELSLKEYKATEIYCKALREQGFEVTEKLCGIDTAFCGSFGSGKPVIGILGEYDALSGLSQIADRTKCEPVVKDGCGHGCGHNLLGAGSFAAAVAVKTYLQNSGNSGTVIFYGCPGEEGGSGKAFMARENLWASLDAALCWHPDTVNEVRTGTNNSSIQVLYKFKGIAAHAASAPDQGRSALDAVELMNIGVQFLREHMTDDCRVHYSILNAGGVSPNVVQAEADVLYMVRANKVIDSVKLLKRVDKIAEGAALMTETSYERVFIDGTSELLPNYALEKLLYKNFEEIGAPKYSDEELAYAAEIKKTFPTENAAPGIGAKFNEDIAELVKEKTEGMTKPLNDFLMPEYSGTGFVAGSTDVGDVSWQTPASQISVVTWPAGTPAHSWQVVSVGKSSIAYKGMLCAGKVLAATAIDLMENPELLAEARTEFAKKSKDGYTCPIEKNAVPIAL